MPRHPFTSLLKLRWTIALLLVGVAGACQKPGGSELESASSKGPDSAAAVDDAADPARPSANPSTQITVAEDTETEDTETEDTAAEDTAAEDTAAEDTAASASAKLTALPDLLTDAEMQEGWIALFDGQTLYGWEANSDANWRVEDGTIVVDQGEKGLLCTTTEFGDYVLKLDFRSAPMTNSGIFLHTPLQPQAPASDCYELNIADSDNPFPTGSLVQRQKAPGDFDSDDWQSYEVAVQGDRVTVRLDGEIVLEYTDPKQLQRGRIGLQLNEGRVAFRDIKLKPLGLHEIFNGRDLAGWNEYPDMASKFSVTDERWLHVRDGRGQLETKAQYGDFVLQLECITHAPRLNSGVFFRCIPGDVMMGYEAQIHNGFLNGDRTQPQDCGTGGIFRRQDARLVAADDQQWFFMTLVADGPHMAAWVNGLQVSDWTDERAPNENPRKGLRSAPGTIMIQGHDPTTDISFRGLRAAETAARPAAISP